MFSSRQLLRAAPLLSRRCLHNLSSCRSPIVLTTSANRCTNAHKSWRFVSTKSPEGAQNVPPTSLEDAATVEEPIPDVLDTTPQDTTYHGPLTMTFRRLKVFSLSSLTLTFALTPFIFIMETTSGLPLVARAALAGVAITTSGVSTGLVAWCGRPYVTTLRWLEPEGGDKHATGSARGLQMTTLTLGLHERNTRVYDTAFLVPASRPFATWELAEAFQLPREEVEAAGRQGTLPGEETIAETLTKDGTVIGRWIVRWDENGAGACREEGKVVRHFNVHQELLDRPIR